MKSVIPFRTIIHADWSVSARKRWMARAECRDGRWLVSATTPAADILQALNEPANHPLLAGFDFPIGLPEGYGRSTRFDDFPSFLRGLDGEGWDEFRNIARHPDEISLRRPFYPAGNTKGIKQMSLVQAHGVDDIDRLRRRSERATPTRRAACSIFWTLGGNQVGRGALSGWEEVIRPCVLGGASLWPFEGTLSDLAIRGGLVLAETYPAEAYGQIGVRFGAKQSKRRQDDRRSHSRIILDWCSSRGVSMTDDAANELLDGFGSGSTGEDRFDAMAGLLGMVAVVIGDLRDAPIAVPTMAWEGWIMGQAAVED